MNFAYQQNAAAIVEEYPFILRILSYKSPPAHFDL